MSSELPASSLVSPAGGGSAGGVRRRRRRWKAAQKRALLHEFEGSGLSAAQFCRDRGLSAVTFSTWRRLARAQSVAAPAGFARVRVLDEPGGGDAAASGVRVDAPGGFRFHVPAGCDPHWVAAVLRALTEG